MQGLTISDRLALELVSMLQEHLCASSFARDRLDLQILLTLSKRLYVDNLLYRDLSVRQSDLVHHLPKHRIHDQAITYLYQVLGRRLRLARNLIDKPTNMHRLFQALCEHGPREHGWPDVRVLRSTELEATLEPSAAVAPVAAVLKRQRHTLGDGYGPESQRRRLKFGPLWLVLGTEVIEMPEEMSLFDVFEAVPKPLYPQFVQATPVRHLVTRVVKSLNERYMLLRSCGLELGDWLEHDQPSIAVLRDLKNLRKESQQRLRNGEALDAPSAYRQAFERLKVPKKKFAGCVDFNDFSCTRYGVAMLKSVSLSLDETISMGQAGDDGLLSETLSESDEDGIEDTVIIQLDVRKNVQALLADTEMDDVLRYIFKHVILGNRPLFGRPADKAVFDDQDFCALIASHTEYMHLDAQALAGELYEKALVIIEQKLQSGTEGQTEYDRKEGLQ